MTVEHTSPSTPDLASQLAPYGPDLVARYQTSGLWSTTETVASIFARATSERPDALAVVDSLGGQLTWAEVGDRSARLGGALQRRGVAKGDVVAVQMSNRAEAMVAVAAIARIGAVVNPMVPAFRRGELTYMLNHCHAKALIVPGVYRKYDHDELGIEVSRDVPSLGTVISISNTTREGIETFQDLIREEPGRDVAVSPSDPTCVMFTSGTEAAPKAVVHSSNSMLASFRQTARLLDLDETDCVFMASPFGHGSGYGIGTLMTALIRGTLVFQAEWEPSSAAELIARHRCTYAHGSTPFLQELSALENVSPEQLGSFRWFVTGGALIPAGLVKSARERLGCVVLRQYGQTEGFITSFNHPTDADEVLASSDGALLPEVEVQIRSEDGNVLPEGEEGEFWIRGPHRCLGFAHDPVRTAASIDPEGWLASGDVGTLDGRGRLSFKRRKKEVINRGGYKYSAAEVESVLLQHPAVQRVAIVAMPDARLGEKACAFISPRGTSSIDLAEICRFLEKHGVAKYKWPERLETLAELPATSSGKIQKFELVKLLSENNPAQAVQEDSRQGATQ
ncbi:AMP-binding protein [Rhodococcus sp. NPDC057014]|uniref:AMP-binding protein n=1 Tax=Rhodococcus sp. NPDC057014 TaxID=3346000 RepID=UPI003638ACE7